jgi:hypothetical protein
MGSSEVASTGSTSHFSVKQVRHLYTAAEAARVLGIPAGSIRAWKSRGRLWAYGIDDRRREMYDRDHLIELRDHGRAYRAEQQQQRLRRCS